MFAFIIFTVLAIAGLIGIYKGISDIKADRPLVGLSLMAFRWRQSLTRDNPSRISGIITLIVLPFVVPLFVFPVWLDVLFWVIWAVVLVSLKSFSGLCRAKGVRFVSPTASANVAAPTAQSNELQ